jgi:hypothetical protein
MAHALAIPENNPLFAKMPLLRVQKGPFTYTVETKNSATTYSVSDGKTSLSVPVHWTFGVDNQTFVFEYEGHWYEGLVSYFAEVNGLDTTIGDDSLHPTTVLEALGRPIVEAERAACFGCHSSGNQPNGIVDLKTLTPGITCDHCHEGALQHQAAALKGSRLGLPPDLRRASPDRVSAFCGQCHRSWETVMRMTQFGPFDVRFQPFRLVNSKCYDGADQRISCVACHDVHAASSPSAQTVTTKCLACHSSSSGTLVKTSATNANPKAKACPVSNTNCASCHMPKVALPGGHRLFTDHYIRVTHTGEAYPY